MIRAICLYMIRFMVRHYRADSRTQSQHGGLQSPFEYYNYNNVMNAVVMLILGVLLVRSLRL